MELSTQGLMNRAEWEAKGYKLPKFDRDAVTKATKENPRWIHFGAGNIFRAFQANVMQNILDRGEMETGLLLLLAVHIFVIIYKISASREKTQISTSEYCGKIYFSITERGRNSTKLNLFAAISVFLVLSVCEKESV